MKILITTPTLGLHGGIRILFEWCNRLTGLGHEVTLFVEKGETICNWYDITFPVTTDRNAYKSFDCIIIGSPHSIWLEDRIQKHQKCFLFMQMDERLFRPKDLIWHRLCRKFYLSRFPIIHGSNWGEEVCRKLGRKGKMHYIGNGVNFEHFPIKQCEKDGKTILLETPVSKNPAKDTDGIALKVAARLKEQGYYIIAYGGNPVENSIIDEYYTNPDLPTLNSLYERATILLKATKYDARALSPMEAFTKGCVVIRGIIAGDDDLYHHINCVKVGYDFVTLYLCSEAVLSDKGMRGILRDNAYFYIQDNCNWETIIQELNEILQS